MQMSCLELQGVFIYIPIGLAMVSNLVMFGLCFFKMYKEEEDLFRKQDQQEVFEQEDTIQSIEDIIKQDQQEHLEHEQTENILSDPEVISIRTNQLAGAVMTIRGRKVFEVRFQLKVEREYSCV